MVRVAGDAHIVVPVEAEALGETLRGVFLSFVGELLGALAQVGVENALQTYGPLARHLLGRALADGSHIRLHHGEELIEVGQRVARQTAGCCHGRFGNDTLFAEDDQHVAGATAL